MTRINLGYDPHKLVDKHLLTEHREITRIPSMIKKNKLYPKDIPTKFSLGKGHVKFFADKILYLKKRYKIIYDECIKRGFNVQDYSSIFDGIDESLMNDYKPNEDDFKIIEERINEKLSMMTNLKYYRESVIFDGKKIIKK